MHGPARGMHVLACPVGFNIPSVRIVVKKTEETIRFNEENYPYS